MKPRVIFLAALALLSACHRPAVIDRAARLHCQAVEGVQSLLARPRGDMILLDGDSAAGAASQAIGCWAAARGERVLWGATQAAAARLIEPVRLLGARGAAVDIFRFEAAPAGDRKDAGDARNAAFARSVATAQARRADRLILVVDPPDAARAPVGLSGETWRPLGARLAPRQTISLRAEHSMRPGIRIRLMSFEDVPVRGAALRYDGIVEVGPQAQQSTALRPSGAHGR